MTQIIVGLSWQSSGNSFTLLLEFFLFFSLFCMCSVFAYHHFLNSVWYIPFWKNQYFLKKYHSSSVIFPSCFIPVLEHIFLTLWKYFYHIPPFFSDSFILFVVYFPCDEECFLCFSDNTLDSFSFSKHSVATKNLYYIMALFTVLVLLKFKFFYLPFSQH